MWNRVKYFITARWRYRSPIKNMTAHYTSHLSHVTCHMSPVKCHLSHVSCTRNLRKPRGLKLLLPKLVSIFQLQFLVKQILSSTTRYYLFCETSAEITTLCQNYSITELKDIKIANFTDNNIWLWKKGYYNTSFPPVSPCTSYKV